MVTVYVWGMRGHSSGSASTGSRATARTGHVPKELPGRINSTLFSACTGAYYIICLVSSYASCRRFSEPVVDGVAHDVMVECSNMGVCDRLRGVCNCADGYEGGACERLSCPVSTGTGAPCHGNGR